MEGISTAKIVRFRTSITKLHISKNRIIVLPVNILTGVVHCLLGPHITLPCVLMSLTTERMNSRYFSSGDISLYLFTCKLLQEVTLKEST